MHDILDLPEVRACVSRMSVARYHETAEYNENGKRTELIRGIVIEKMSKSPLHSSINTRLLRRLAAATPPGYVFCKDEPLTLADSEPEPDMFIVEGREGDFDSRHPITAALAVEVSVSSVVLDHEKASIYAEAGVLEYWIVVALQQQVEVYRAPEGGRYREVRTYSRGETLECASVPEIRITLAEIFPA